MKKLVFIVGRGHSGSTLLSLILSNHSKLVSLGEISDTSDQGVWDSVNYPKYPCSCGNSIQDCRFWPNVENRASGTYESRLAIFYEDVVTSVNSIYDESTIAVDSTKRISKLNIIARKTDLTLRIIFLTKDVRNYAVSRAAERSGSMLKFFRQWRKQNRLVLEELNRHSLPSFTIGYEELCLGANALIPQLCAFIGIEPEAQMLNFENADHHILRGNRMRKDPAKNQAIHYDSRWFRRRDWLLASPLLPGVMQLNDELVYSNQIESIFESG